MRRTSAPPPDDPSPPAESVIARLAIVKGYEFEKGKFVLFTAKELKTVERDLDRRSISSLSFLKMRSIQSTTARHTYWHLIRSKPYNLWLRAMRDTGRCALAKWAFPSKECVVQIRAANGGMVVQQLWCCTDRGCGWSLVRARRASQPPAANCLQGINCALPEGVLQRLSIGPRGRWKPPR